MTRHFLEVDDLSADELTAVLSLARSQPGPMLTGRGVALLFEHPSNRTRNATEMAVVQLGGHPVSLHGPEVGLDTREPAEDVARVLAGYHAVVCARVATHSTLERMAAAIDRAGARVPVVNLLSDLAHPCQALADLLTIEECLGTIRDVTVAYVGDANNVCRSLTRACALAGARCRVASPAGYTLAPSDVDAARSLGGDLTLTDRPEDAVKGADVVYTDVWTSMGQEDEVRARRDAFAGFTIDSDLVDLASPEAIILHCLPAHRGEEIAADVVDGPRSRVWQQATNRMHAARGLLAWLVQETGG